MSGAGNGLSLRFSVTVISPPDVAFDAFTSRLGEWWVREFSWSGPDRLQAIGIEPRPGGMAYEIGPHGFRMDWGRVLYWEPPHRLVLSWHIAPDRVPEPDPAQASELEVRFHPRRDGTVVDLEHRHFERHGPDAAGYRRAMTEGWQDMLQRYSETCRSVSDAADNTSTSAA